MHRRLQFDERENPASDRRYDSRSTVAMEAPPNIVDDSLSESNVPAQAATNRAATGEKRPEDRLLTSNVITSTSTGPEPFVSADEAAQFLCVKRRYLLELARRGIVGAYPLGTGRMRKIWVFRLSELADSVPRNETLAKKLPKPCTISSGSPR